MGSGCAKQNFNHCTNPVSDKCVFYTGDSIPALGICNGDTLSEIEEVILAKIQQFIEGEGIVLSDLTAACIPEITGSQDLRDVLQLILESQCSLKTLVNTLQNQVNAPVIYSTQCLTVNGSSTPAIVQSLIDEVCSLKTQVETLTEQLENDDLTTTLNTTIGNFLLNAITACDSMNVRASGSGASVVINIDGLVPPDTPLWSYADLSNFDSSGMGIGRFCGWKICNGLNGTENLMGYSRAMATNLPGINSTNLDSRVDPVAANDSSWAANMSERKGTPKVGLTVGNLPSHSHGVNDPSHSHTVGGGYAFQSTLHGTGTNLNSNGNDAVQFGHGSTNAMNNSSTGITINATGSNEYHENRQPTIYGIYIVRV